MTWPTGTWQERPKFHVTPSSLSQPHLSPFSPLNTDISPLLVLFPLSETLSDHSPLPLPYSSLMSQLLREDSPDKVSYMFLYHIILSIITPDPIIIVHILVSSFGLLPSFLPNNYFYVGTAFISVFVEMLLVVILPCLT